MPTLVRLYFSTGFTRDKIIEDSRDTLICDGGAYFRKQGDEPDGLPAYREDPTMTTKPWAPSRSRRQRR